MRFAHYYICWYCISLVSTALYRLELSGIRYQLLIDQTLRNIKDLRLFQAMIRLFQVMIRLFQAMIRLFQVMIRLFQAMIRSFQDTQHIFISRY